MELQDDDLPTFEVMQLADYGGAFDFWLDEAEDVYSRDDGESVEE